MNRFDVQEILETVRDLDAREITADSITEWHEQIGHLPKPAAQEAVHIHHKTSSERITPQHVLALAAGIAERKPNQRPGRSRVVTQAYTLSGALSNHCPRCKAEPGEYCTNPVTGDVAHAPCLARFAEQKVPA